MTASVRAARLGDSEYQRLLAFRTELRRFLQWSEEMAHAEGVTPAQHQLLLSVRGSTTAGGPTISEVAGALLLRHHSAVELVDRCVAADLVDRFTDSNDRRVVRLRLTSRGSRTLARLASRHLDELAHLGNVLRALDMDAVYERRARSG